MSTVYGDKGNRWWVGQNVGESGGQSTVFGAPSTEFIGKPSGYESLPSGNAADDKQFAAAAAKDKANPSSPVTISVENVKWYNINGPYATQAAASAAIAAIQKADPAKGAVSQAASNNGVPTSWQKALTGFLSAIDSSATWVRVAKVVIGGALVVVGLAKITGAGDAVGDVVKKTPVGLGLW